LKIYAYSHKELYFSYILGKTNLDHLVCAFYDHMSILVKISVGQRTK